MSPSITSLIDADTIANLSGLATIVIAIFTIVYAWTTKGQLKVMSRQLSEMENQRKLYSQPMVVLKNIASIFQNPSVYIDHESHNVVFLSRFSSEFEITNIGNTPVVGGKVYTKLFKSKLDVKSLMDHEYNDFAYIEVGKSVKFSILFPQSIDLLEHIIVINNLLKKMHCETTISANNNMPLLQVKVAYKNFTGAYFMSETKLRICIHDDSTQAAAWYDALKLASVTFQKELTEYGAQLKTNQQQAEATFKKIGQAFTDSLNCTDDLKLEVIIDDMIFNIIDEDTYNNFGNLEKQS